MNRFIISFLLALFFLPIYAEEIPEKAIQSQEYDQELCEQKIVNHCISILCTETKDSNCKKTCEENAKNECRQAGE